MLPLGSLPPDRILARISALVVRRRAASIEVVRDGHRTWSRPDDRGATAGLGPIARWSVNDVCTRVRVERRSGATRVFRLRRYEFQNGDHFLKSLLAIGPHALFVTHQHGAFLVSDRGRMLRELSFRPPESFEVRGRTVVRSRLPEGPYDYWLRARGWNGRTILATDVDARHGYAVLIDRRLVRTRAFEFTGRKVVNVRLDGARGWALGLQDKDGTVWLRIGNAGDWRWISP